MLKIRLLEAGIAQLVEHDLAKVGVASSSLVSRSKFKNPAWSQSIAGFFYCLHLLPFKIKPSIRLFFVA
jgi:hypothetical protein